MHELLITKSITDYQQSLRAASRFLYTFDDFTNFSLSMQSAIDRNLTQAWLAGAASCGIAESELTTEEFLALGELINTSIASITSLGAWIVTVRGRGEPFSALSPRLAIWANRWREAFNQAKAMACGDQKQIWVLGPTDHCSTCKSMAGKVKRASFWQASGILPQSSSLACGGWNCLCSLRDTDLPLSRGPLPSAP